MMGATHGKWSATHESSSYSNPFRLCPSWLLLTTNLQFYKPMNAINQIDVFFHRHLFCTHFFVLWRRFILRAGKSECELNYTHNCLPLYSLQQKCMKLGEKSKVDWSSEGQRLLSVACFEEGGLQSDTVLAYHSTFVYYYISKERGKWWKKMAHILWFDSL